MLKLLALLTMLVDHIGFLFFPYDMTFRIIGRIAMPIYAYSIAKGYKYSILNNSFPNYFKRIFILAFISQIPFYLTISHHSLNICFLWLSSLAILWILCHENIHNFLKVSAIGAIVFLSIFFKVEYDFYGIGFVLIFYFFQVNKKDDLKTIISFILLHFIFYYFNPYTPLIQLYAFVSILLIMFFAKYDKFRVNKYVHYVFYPLHILILFMIGKYFLHSLRFFYF